MAEYASNVPISRPRNTGWRVSWDCNGLVWSNDYGIFFHPVAEMVPIKEPIRLPGKDR